MWLIFGIFATGLVLYLLAILSIIQDWDIEGIFLSYGTAAIVIGLIFLPIVAKSELEQQAKDILVKGNPYEMVIQYELKDSLYVPADTIFILKKK